MSDLKKLYFYNVLVSASLTVISDFIFIDLLLLRIGTGVALVGAIKALIFFLPVVSYQLAAPLLNKWRCEVPLCAWCYLLRTLLPMLIPAAAVLGAGNAALRWMCAVLLPTGLMLATFANNALMIIYHREFPADGFNRCSGIVHMCFYLPGLALGFPVSMWLSHAAKLPDAKFFAAYLAAGALCGAFQLPAFAIMRTLKSGAAAGSGAVPEKAAGGMLVPYRDRESRGTLLVTFLHALAIGGGTAYIGVFCLKILQASVSTTFVLRTAAAGAGALLMPFAGKLADRFGYRRVFVCGGLLMMAGVGAPAAFPHLWVLPLCALLFWDGAVSPVGAAMQMCEQAAASKLASDRDTAGYIAAFNVARMSGMGLGSLLSGALVALFRRLGSTEETGLRLVFAACLALLLPMIVAAVRLFPARKEKVTT